MKHLNNVRLIAAFRKEIEKEKTTTANVVAYIHEIDRRRLYLDFDCTSLYQYLTQKAGYSNSSAQRRIEASRFLEDAPDLCEDLISGLINLSQTSQISRLIRRREKAVRVDAQKRRDLLAAVRGMSTHQTEIEVCRLLEIEPKSIELARVQADESVRREITFSKEEEEVLRRVADVISHSDSRLEFSDLVMLLANFYLDQRDPLRKSDVDPTTTAVVNNTSRRSRHIPSTVRRYVFKTQRCCQQKLQNGSICGSTYRLEIDHIVPYHLGGTHDIENLQLLCDVHNRHKYRVGRQKQKAGRPTSFS